MTYIKCPQCNGTGLSNETIFCKKCLGNGKIKKPLTNFQHITQTEETLADFMYCLTEVYHYYVGENMGTIMQYANEDANDKNHVDLIHGNRDFDELMEWLRQESE